MDPIKCGGFLKELRKEKGLTQAQLAERLGVTNRTVSRWETGTNLPDFDVIIFLSELYGVDIRELLDGERKTSMEPGKETTESRLPPEKKEMLLKTAEYCAERENKAWKKQVFFGSIAAVLFIALLSVSVIFSVLNDPGHTDNACPLSVFWDGGVYYCYMDGMLPAGAIEEEMILGSITSLTDISELPDENGEANFPAAENGSIAEYEGRLYLRFSNGSWYLLYPKESVR